MISLSKYHFDNIMLRRGLNVAQNTSYIFAIPNLGQLIKFREGVRYKSKIKAIVFSLSFKIQRVIVIDLFVLLLLVYIYDMDQDICVVVFKFAPAMAMYE